MIWKQQSIYSFGRWQIWFDCHGLRVKPNLVVCVVALDNAQFQIMDFTWFGLLWFSTVLSIVWPRSLLLCLFHKKLRIWKKKLLGFAKQIICDLVSSCIVILIDNLLDQIWKLVNLVSYVNQQRGSPWLYALEIFHNNSCFCRGRVEWSFLMLWLW